ncbi:MAG: hypothetical protein IIY88_01830 [Eubacterium sp.]|nr:hypothetical protein [Eubacterium sp.]
MKPKKNTSRVKLLHRSGGKRGSYIVEASVIVPAFLIAFFMLISLIPVIAACENITYIAAEEVRLEDAKSAFRENRAALPVALNVRARAGNKDLSGFYTRGYKYRYSDHGMDDLISISFRAVFKEKNPLGLYSRVTFDGTVTGRAFTGKKTDSEPDRTMSGDNDRMVYIFPDWGKKYHKANCTHVKANCRLVYLTGDVKSKYHACPNCGSGSAAVGSPVFIFESDGEAYHYRACKSVTRYCVQVRKSTAEASGYGPCSKCGG